MARITLAVVMTAVMLPMAAPAASGVADDDIPGVAIPASPFTGSLNETTDYDDVYKVYLKAGQSLTVTFKGPDTADFDLYLYPPGTTTVDDVAPVVSQSGSMGSVELLNYMAKTSGTYYLDVYASFGSGSYTLAWRVENEVPGLTTTPIEGIGRIETAIDASRWVDSSATDYVIIATARSFPDALGGSALAGLLHAPILLTEPTMLPASVATEIVENRWATKIIILGGTGAVSQGVENQLKALVGAEGSVERIAGADRYATAEAVAARVIGLLEPPTPDAPLTAFVATGEGFPDALAGSPYAAWGGFPFFLVHPGTDPAQFAATLTTAGIGQAVILGGTGVVPTSIETALSGAGIEIQDRLAGDDRYWTAAAIAASFVHNKGLNFEPVNEIAFTTGTNFPDALAGGAALGQVSGGGVPLVLTAPTVLEPAARSFLTNWGGYSYVDFVGGLGALSVHTRAAIRTALTGVSVLALPTTSVPRAIPRNIATSETPRQPAERPAEVLPGK